MKYDAPNTRNAQLGFYDGSTKCGFPTSNIRGIFHRFFNTWFASLSSTVSDGVKFCFVLPALLFVDYVSRTLLVTTAYARS